MGCPQPAGFHKGGALGEAPPALCGESALNTHCGGADLRADQAAGAYAAILLCPAGADERVPRPAGADGQSPPPEAGLCKRNPGRQEQRCGDDYDVHGHGACHCFERGLSVSGREPELRALRRPYPAAVGGRLPAPAAVYYDQRC